MKESELWLDVAERLELWLSSETAEYDGRIYLCNQIQLSDVSKESIARSRVHLFAPTERVGRAYWSSSKSYTDNKDNSDYGEASGRVTAAWFLYWMALDEEERKEKEEKEVAKICELHPEDEDFMEKFNRIQKEMNS